MKASAEELELLVSGMLYGSLLKNQSFTSEFAVTPVRGKDGIFRNRVSLDGELGEFEISVKMVKEEIALPEKTE